MAEGREKISVLGPGGRDEATQLHVAKGAWGQRDTWWPFPTIKRVWNCMLKRFRTKFLKKKFSERLSRSPYCRDRQKDTSKDADCAVTYIEVTYYALHRLLSANGNCQHQCKNTRTHLTTLPLVLRSLVPRTSAFWLTGSEEAVEPWYRHLLASLCYVTGGSTHAYGRLIACQQ